MFLLQIFAIFVMSILFGILGSISSWNKNLFLGHVLSHSLLLPPALCFVFGVTSDSIITVASLVFSVCFALFYFFADRTMKSDDNTVLLIASLICTSLAMILAFHSKKTVDFMNYVVGDILLVDKFQVTMLYIVSVLTLLYLFLFWRVILLYAFNRDIATVLFPYAPIIGCFGIVLQSISITLSINAIGALLMSGTYIVPSVLAKTFSDSPKTMVCYSVLIALFINSIGFFLSVYFNIPTAPVLVMIYGLIGIPILLFRSFCRF